MGESSFKRDLATTLLSVFLVALVISVSNFAVRFSDFASLENIYYWKKIAVDHNYLSSEFSPHIADNFVRFFIISLALSIPSGIGVMIFGYARGENNRFRDDLRRKMRERNLTFIFTIMLLVSFLTFWIFFLPTPFISIDEFLRFKYDPYFRGQLFATIFGISYGYYIAIFVYGLSLYTISPT